jgi:serine/threonine-protein kinase
LELVDGPTLADRLAYGPLAVDEALTIARQIADAWKRRTRRASSIAI